MRLYMIAGAALLGITLCANIGDDPARAQRARINYEALVSGQKQLNQFSPQELADMVELDKALRGKADGRSPAQRCRDRETERVGGSPSDLERNVIDMKCRALGEPLN